MLIKQERHIGWALAISLAIHAVLLFFVLKTAPWRTGEFSTGEPILVQLKASAATKGEKDKQPERVDIPQEKPEQTKVIANKIPQPVVPPPDRISPQRTTTPEKEAVSIQPGERLISVEPVSSGEVVDAAQPSDQSLRLNTGGQYKKDYQAYSEMLRQTIERNQRYPVMSIRSRQQGTVMISFTLRNDGELVECRVSRSCGYQLLDRAALRAVQSTERYPPFPESFTSKQTEFVVPVTFMIDSQ